MKPAEGVLVFLILLSSCLPIVLSECIKKEREGLLKFKGRLRDPFLVLSSWVGENCCQWDGVTCDNFTGHVIMLDFENRHGQEWKDTIHTTGLEGEIDPYLCNLEHLQYLSLRYNNFGSIVPTFLDCFQKLRYLNFAFSSFSGDIPSKLGNLSNLETLDLSSNRLEINNTEPFGRLSSLRILDISFNHLVDSSGLFHSLNKLSCISDIGCIGCQMQVLPESLPFLNFTLLTNLDLSYNEFNVTIPPWIFQIRSLEYLDLSAEIPSISDSSGRIIQPFPDSVENLHNLKFLGFSSLRLSGSVPLISLERLEELHLCCNLLSGPVPQFSERISALSLLDLSFNQFNGSIPESLGSLPMLQNIYLQNNQLSGIIPESLCGLKSIKVLELSMNDHIEGTIPDCLWQQSGMEVLGLGGIGLEGVISETQLSKFTNLSYLTISSSKSSLVLNTSDDWIPPFSLRSLIMTSCTVGPRFPLWIETQSSLYGLNLSNSGISGSLPVWIWNFSFVLSVLDLSNNSMDGEASIPNISTSQNSLIFINLSSNRLQGSTFLSLFQIMGNRWYLDLSMNNLSGEIPLSICEASNNPVMLDISGNSISGEIPICFKIFTFLNLANNNLTGSLQVPNDSTCELVSLYLENNDLSGNILSDLRSCWRMVVLDLGDNKFVEDIPVWLPERMRYLKILRLRSNRFSGTIPRQLSNLTSLQVLDLAHNNISGMIPDTFGNFTAMKLGPIRTVTVFPRRNDYVLPSSNYPRQMMTLLTQGTKDDAVFIFTKGANRRYTKELQLLRSIDLSGNELFGEIPREIGNLQYLNNLILSSNHLTGSIPETMSNLRSLDALDLSNNSLSGEIPQDMSKLTFLGSLNLSYNNLSGRIPGPQFLTFSNLSFVGNPYLCGFPLQSCEHVDPNTTLPSGKGGNDEYNYPDPLGVYISLVLGFIIGFWTFYGTLFFNRTWRYKYFGFFSDLYTVVLGRRP